MNLNKKTKNILKVSSVAAMSATALITSAVLLNNQEKNNKNLSLNNAQTKNNSSKGQENSRVSNNFVNPNEIYFISESLTNLELWEGNEDETGTINTSKETKLLTFINQVKQLSTTNTALAPLSPIATAIEKYIDYINAKKEMLFAIKDSDLLKSMWESTLKPALLEKTGGKANISEIDNIEQVPVFLKEASGLGFSDASNASISSISHKNITKKDLLSSDGAQDLTGVEQVAGTGYKTLVKIAEFDLSTNKDIVLEFDFKASASSSVAKGRIVLKNKNGVLASATTIKDAYDNLDIFGRYANMGPNDVIGAQGSRFIPFIENFGLSKNGSTLSVMARLKEGQSLSQIRLVGSDVSPTKFGIIDVQATGTGTFESILAANTAETKLLSTTDNVIKVQFFSDKLKAEKISSKDKNASIENRKIQFYQKADKMKFDVHYANNKKAPVGNRSYTLLNNYKDGENTGVPVSFEIDFDGTAPSGFGGATTASPAAYQFYAGLKDDLAEGLAAKLESISLAKLESTVKNKIAKQVISFSDEFYGLGKRPTWDVDISGTYEILLNDITDKVFFEKPDSFDESTSGQSKITQTHAKEQVDQLLNVKQAFGQIYSDWANNVTADYIDASQKFSFITQQFNEQNGTFNSSTVSGNGNELYAGLNIYWEKIVNEIKKTSPDFDASGDILKRYNVTKFSANTIVDKWLINSPYITNNSEISKIIKEALVIYQNDPLSGEGPAFSSLKLETKKGLQEKLVALVSQQYLAIKNEFDSKINTRVYDQFVQVFANQDTKSRKVLKQSTDLLETINVPQSKTGETVSLVKYKKGLDYSQIATTKETTVKDSVTSMWKLLDSNSLASSIFNIQSTLQIFESSDAEQMANLSTNASFEQKEEIMIVYRSLMLFFGFDLQEAINNSSVNEPLVFKVDGKNLSLEQVFDNILDKLSSDKAMYSFILPSGSVVRSNYLDNIISGTNARIAMQNKKKTLDATASNYSQLLDQINDILNQQQANGGELAAWSRAVGMEANYASSYNPQFSGRNTDAELIKVYNEITNNENILKRRSEDFTSASLPNIQEAMSYAWFAIAALSAVGIVTASAVGISSSRSRTMKLSSRPVIKWLLFAGVVVGIVVLALALTLGIMPLI